jgi:predicted nucleic acid-binding protein
MALACVLDASAAVRLILADPAAADLAERVGGAALVLAPELMLSELANTLWKLQRADRLNDLDPQELLAEALALACHLNHPVYDCLYLALARAGSGQPDQQRSAPERPGRKGVALSPGDTSSRPHPPLELLQHPIKLAAERSRSEAGGSNCIETIPRSRLLHLDVGMHLIKNSGIYPSSSKCYPQNALTIV